MERYQQGGGGRGKLGDESRRRMEKEKEKRREEKRREERVELDGYGSLFGYLCCVRWEERGQLVGEQGQIRLKPDQAGRAHGLILSGGWQLARGGRLRDRVSILVSRILRIMNGLVCGLTMRCASSCDDWSFTSCDAGIDIYQLPHSSGLTLSSLTRLFF
ncbi:hypothetical protein L249_1994 [Ophiocordyceps polyrhachis-furcata BCC 54312]|uniref:Uncharacterized protein n=1 Tax=Ophiocordyceps polyrhachis-furcata BCC 54312 TaxID=1330021 RepID=A0A367LSB0_9HYPO|nr:hypothetical protein L249_1994 [Ophiocordyceps polyrhachis-furcata BCC 54312]